MSLFTLENKVALVTGAGGGGLGSAAAMCFAAHGADLALLGLHEESLQETRKEIEQETGRKAITVVADVTDEDAVKAAVDKVMGEYGKIDVLLNNAGIALTGDVVHMEKKDWDKTMDINVGGIYLMSKYVVPHMQEAKYGKIINIASINAIIADKDPTLYRHAYNASKSAVLGLTRGMAASYMKDGITVNAVGPGLFKTNMTRDTLFAHDGFMKLYNSLSPAGRPGEEYELTGTLIYFATDASSYVTGQVIYVDGGMSIV